MKTWKVEKRKLDGWSIWNYQFEITREFQIHFVVNDNC